MSQRRKNLRIYLNTEYNLFTCIYIFKKSHSWPTILTSRVTLNSKARNVSVLSIQSSSVSALRLFHPTPPRRAIKPKLQSVPVSDKTSFPFRNENPSKKRKEKPPAIFPPLPLDGEREREKNAVMFIQCHSDDLLKVNPLNHTDKKDVMWKRCQTEQQKLASAYECALGCSSAWGTERAKSLSPQSVSPSKSNHPPPPHGPPESHKKNPNTETSLSRHAEVKKSFSNHGGFRGSHVPESPSWPQPGGGGRGWGGAHGPSPTTIFSAQTLKYTYFNARSVRRSGGELEKQLQIRAQVRLYGQLTLK